MHRRNFLMKTAFAAGSFSALPLLARSNTFSTPPDELMLIGPKDGYSPQVGTLVSMLNYNRSTIIGITKGLTIEQLDYLHDPKANTIGALIMHLGATEAFYQANTFEGRDDFNETEKKLWNDAMSLGDAGRKNIKGQELKYYIDRITEVREKTLRELKSKDDKWLMEIDKKWSNEKDRSTPTGNGFMYVNTNLITAGRLPG
ncbi:DinB family protein [Niabella sp. W65]|nr:DinB family protein [Niabella sp. W65]MCH7368795.1 DinB family protein [Niabella sp. W65]ULT44372.1 DinB family protein [Niabella sp. I65]